MRVGKKAKGAKERWERNVIYVWSRFTVSSPYHETSPSSDNHTAADLFVCVCERVHVTACAFLFFFNINMCAWECVHMCAWTEGQPLSSNISYTVDTAHGVYALHGVLCVPGVCVRAPLLCPWSTKSAVLLQWIKPMIHGLHPHSVSAAHIYPQPDR